MINTSCYYEIYNSDYLYKKVKIDQVYLRPIVLFFVDDSGNFGLANITINEKEALGKVTWINNIKIFELSVKREKNNSLTLYFKQARETTTASIMSFSRIGYYHPTFYESMESNKSEFDSGNLVTDYYLNSR